MRKEITEAQITELMRAIPRAEEVDRLRAENERLRENVDRLGKEVERSDRLREEIARVKADNRSLVNRALEAKP
jgi:ubiquinone biosynthesis protein UbiJ